MAWKAKEPMKPEVAVERLESMCARAEHCRSELREKLFRWRVPGDAAEKILDSLEKNRFLDERRFAIAFCRSKAIYSRWGRRKIVYALKAKRISGEIITEAVEALEEDEYRSVMIELLRTKGASIKEGNTFEGRTKIYRFGVQRGYEPELVAAALRAGVVWGKGE